MGKYVGIVDKSGAAVMFSGPDVIVSTICAAVAFRERGKADRIVQRGTRYRRGDEPKGLQTRADKMAEKWNSYLKRTGKRWELEQDAKNKAKADKLKAERAKRRAVLEAGPETLAMLERMVKALRFGDEPPLIEADALIARLK